MKNLFYLAAILLSAVTIVSCNNEKHPADSLKTDSTTTIHNEGVNIAFTDTGKSDTTLLFVHGWAINRGYWKDQVEHFSKRYRVVTIDLPGFGQSGKNRDRWGTMQYSADVDSVIKELGLNKVILIGHSMAGDIVLQAAVESPGQVIGIVGVDNFKNVGQPSNPEAKKQYADAIEQMKHNFKKVAFGYINGQLFSATTSPEVKKRVLNDVAHADTAIAVASMSQQDMGFDEIAKLQQTKKTLYLINSDVTPTDTTYMSAKNVPFKIYYTKGTGHYAMIENPDEFNANLDMVIDDIKKKP